MKILIITQKVDKRDPILGFFHRWLEEFAKHAEKVIVVCLERGEYSLPDEVRVLSLGKEAGMNRFQYLINFYQYIWKERHEYDVVFVHMNQIYVLLGSPLWKFLHKRVGLWYTHKQVNFSLKIALIFLDHIFTASKKSFRLKNRKVHIVGHGIDISRFSPNNPYKSSNKILTAGRISPTKNIHIIIDALSILKNKGRILMLDVVGEPIFPKDRDYFKKLVLQVDNLGLTEQVKFCGKVENERMPEIYREANIFINLSDTGSLDKAVLEAMACGAKVLTSNESFEEFLDSRYLTDVNAEDVASHIILIEDQPEDSRLRETVYAYHNLTTLIPRILDFYRS